MSEPSVFNVPFTPQQANVLIELINLATKAGGLRVAANAVILHDLIQHHYKAATEAQPAPKAKDFEAQDPIPVPAKALPTPF